MCVISFSVCPARAGFVLQLPAAGLLFGGALLVVFILFGFCRVKSPDP